MQKLIYREYQIIASAFQDDNGKWIGQASITPLSDESPIRIDDPMVFDNETFDEEKNAEDFALDGAQFFLDDFLQNSGSQ